MPAKRRPESAKDAEKARFPAPVGPLHVVGQVALQSLNAAPLHPRSNPPTRRKHNYTTTQLHRKGFHHVRHHAYRHE